MLFATYIFKSISFPKYASEFINLNSLGKTAKFYIIHYGNEAKSIGRFILYSIGSLTIFS